MIRSYLRNRRMRRDAITRLVNASRPMTMWPAKVEPDRKELAEALRVLVYDVTRRRPTTGAVQNAVRVLEHYDRSMQPQRPQPDSLGKRGRA